MTDQTQTPAQTPTARAPYVEITPKLILGGQTPNERKPVIEAYFSDPSSAFTAAQGAEMLGLHYVLSAYIAPDSVGDTEAVREYRLLVYRELISEIGPLATAGETPDA